MTMGNQQFLCSYIWKIEKKKKGDKGKSANSFPYDLRERLITRYVEISASKYVEIQKNQGW